MLKLFAGSWAVGQHYPLQLLLILEKDLALSGWMTWTAQGVKLPSPNVKPLYGESITVVMEKMLVLCAWVSLTCVTTCLTSVVCGGMFEMPYGTLFLSCDSKTIVLFFKQGCGWIYLCTPLLPIQKLIITLWCCSPACHWLCRRI